jgi:glycosyltransferase involved in cell wall biosynthesis
VTQLQSRSGEPDDTGDAAGSRWRPRVALVLATSAGGIGAHVADLARRLAAEGAAVTVCGPAATNERFGFDTIAPAPPQVPHGAADAGRVRFLPVEISMGTHPSDTRAVAALRRMLAHAQPDVVHAHGLRAGLVAALARRARAARAPLVVTLHNAVLARGLRGGASRLAERIVARSADVVLGASADLVARAREAGAADARLAPVAAPPLPPPRRTRAAVRAELGVPADAPLLLSVGRLHPQKGYDVLVSAAARWRDRLPRPAVVIAGDGPSYLGLAARISAVRAPVTLLGHRDDVSDLLTAADLAVVTSVWEARQLFAQEALRAGVPLVATAVGGIPDLVGDAAVLVPAGDVDAVDRAVRRLLDDPPALERYAVLGQARAGTWPTVEQTLAQVRGVYEELVHGQPGERA